MLLLVDNGSIFTKNIVEFLSTTNVQFTYLSFDKINPDDIHRSQFFILSGRRHNNKKMNALNSEIINHTISEKKQLFGICYGAEILALTVGGTIRKMKSLQKGENFVSVINDNPLCSGMMQVYQSHSFEISNLGKSLVHLGRSEQCKYEIIQYKNHKIFGTQFHPEMTRDGLSMIAKFLTL